MPHRLPAHPAAERTRWKKPVHVKITHQGGIEHSIFKETAAVTVGALHTEGMTPSWGNCCQSGNSPEGRAATVPEWEQSWGEGCHICHLARVEPILREGLAQMPPGRSGNSPEGRAATTATLPEWGQSWGNCCCSCQARMGTCLKGPWSAASSTPEQGRTTEEQSCRNC